MIVIIHFFFLLKKEKKKYQYVDEHKLIIVCMILCHILNELYYAFIYIIFIIDA